MTLGADESQSLDADGPRTSGSGFYIALAAWIPLALCVVVAASPTEAQQPAHDCGIWGCATNNAFALGLLLVPSTPIALGLAAWAHRRASHVLRTFPDSVEAPTASTARFLARLAVVGTIAAWAWVFH